MKNSILCCIILLLFSVANLSAVVSATGVIIPKYIQGMNGTNNDRMHCAFRVQLTGLLPMDTYRYFPSMVYPADAPTYNGASNAMYISPTGVFNRSTVQSLTISGNYGTFTTDAGGSYTGWFIVEPTANLRFTPGGILQLQINLNDGGVGTTVVDRVRVPEPIRVINWGPGTTEGTLLRGNLGSDDKEFIAFYGGSGVDRGCIAATYVENDGVDLSGVTSIAAPYRALVDNLGGNYGVIIPNDSQFTCDRIEKYRWDLDGIIGFYDEPDGFWGNVDLHNPTGGLTSPLMISTRCVETLLIGTYGVTFNGPLMAGDVSIFRIDVKLAAAAPDSREIKIDIEDLLNDPSFWPEKGMIIDLPAITQPGNLQLDSLIVELPTAGLARTYRYLAPNWESVPSVILPGSVTIIPPPDKSRGSSRYAITSDQTLPVELSSFTANLTADYYVRLNWTTQSETNLMGYYIFRTEDEDVNNALIIGPMINSTNSSTTCNYEFTDSDVMTNATYRYWLQSVDLDGSTSLFGPICIFVNGNPGDNPPPVVGLQDGLQCVYPNPFGRYATISYVLTKNRQVRMDVYNIRGQLIKKLLNTEKAEGVYRIAWDGTDQNGKICSDGAYLIKMNYDGKTSALKAVIIK